MGQKKVKCRLYVVSWNLAQILKCPYNFPSWGFRKLFAEYNLEFVGEAQCSPEMISTKIFVA